MVGSWLKKLVIGYFNYYALYDNLEILLAFKFSLGRLCMKIVRHRSHKAKINWDKFTTIIYKWLPEPKLVPPYP
jgi:hypothetical protein